LELRWEQYEFIRRRIHRRRIHWETNSPGDEFTGDEFTGDEFTGDEFTVAPFLLLPRKKIITGIKDSDEYFNLCGTFSFHLVSKSGDDLAVLLKVGYRKGGTSLC
jgi:hypothetical protein